MIKFLILGNMNAIAYKEIFPYIKNNELWLGNHGLGKDFFFGITDEYKEEIVKSKTQGGGWKVIDGEIMGRVANACWFTNIPHNKNQETLVLTKTYNPIDYPKYDNYDAIEVSKVKDIPIDYDGVMGVPITFLDKYCNSQFEIVGVASDTRYDNDAFIQGEQTYIDKEHKKYVGMVLNGKPTYTRILIKKNAEFEIVGHEHDVDGNGTSLNQFEINGKGVYKRLLIRKIK